MNHASDAGEGVGDGEHVRAVRCWINGVAGELIPVQDRGLQYGDGLFETILVRSGAARFIDLHLRRLRRGCERLQIHTVDVNVIAAELRQAAASLEAGILKLIVTRGVGRNRGYSGAECGLATRILLTYPGLSQVAEAARVDFSAVVLGDSPQLAGLKHLNRLENVLARTAMPSNLDEVLLCDARGAIIGGSMSNLFVSTGSGWLTPRLQRCGVAGVMRQVVMREAATLGIAVQEVDVTRTELGNANEMFLTNARLEVWPIWQCAARPLQIGSVTRALRARIQALDGSR